MFDVTVILFWLICDRCCDHNEDFVGLLSGDLNSLGTGFQVYFSRNGK